MADGKRGAPFFGLAAKFTKLTQSVRNGSRVIQKDGAAKRRYAKPLGDLESDGMRRRETVDEIEMASRKIRQHFLHETSVGGGARAHMIVYANHSRYGRQVLPDDPIHLTSWHSHPKLVRADVSRSIGYRLHGQMQHHFMARVATRLGREPRVRQARHYGKRERAWHFRKSSCNLPALPQVVDHDRNAGDPGHLDEIKRPQSPSLELCRDFRRANGYFPGDSLCASAGGKNGQRPLDLLTPRLSP